MSIGKNKNCQEKYIFDGLATDRANVLISCRFPTDKEIFFPTGGLSFFWWFLLTKKNYLPSRFSNCPVGLSPSGKFQIPCRASLDGSPSGKLDFHFPDSFFNFPDGNRAVREFQLSSSESRAWCIIFANFNF
jgi:hypothetical protein